jgi:hypothetical protein
MPAWSPTGHRAVSKFGVWLYAWELPHGSGDLRERLDKLTNARESQDNVLVWPF